MLLLSETLEDVSRRTSMTWFSSKLSPIKEFSKTSSLYIILVRVIPIRENGGEIRVDALQLTIFLRLRYHTSYRGQRQSCPEGILPGPRTWTCNWRAEVWNYRIQREVSFYLTYVHGFLYKFWPGLASKKACVRTWLSSGPKPSFDKSLRITLRDMFTI